MILISDYRFCSWAWIKLKYDPFFVTFNTFLISFEIYHTTIDPPFRWCPPPSHGVPPLAGILAMGIRYAGTERTTIRDLMLAHLRGFMDAKSVAPVMDVVG